MGKAKSMTKMKDKKEIMASLKGRIGLLSKSIKYAKKNHGMKVKIRSKTIKGCI